MRLLILGNHDSWHVRDLLRAAAEDSRIASVQVVPFATLSARLDLFATRPTEPPRGPVEPRHALAEAIGGAQPWDPDRDVVLVRRMPTGTLEQIIFRMDVLGGYERGGGVVVNRPRALEIAIDKYLTLSRLSGAGIRVPRTCVTQSLDEAIQAVESFGDVVVKPIFGSEGKGMSRWDRGADLHAAFAPMLQGGAVLYVQEFVGDASGDIRLLVIGNQVLAMRRECQGDWRANVAQGGRGVPLEIGEDLRELALRAAAAVDGDLVAVDCLPCSEGGHCVLEVNGVPGWRALSHILGRDISKMVVEFMVRRWNER